jgi:hypothetical protein
LENSSFTDSLSKEEWLMLALRVVVSRLFFARCLRSIVVWVPKGSHRKLFHVFLVLSEITDLNVVGHVEMLTVSKDLKPN